ncbi:MAG: hypothetical protein IPN97_16115 [Saprospiraceae bacterium]|nr:hypothetical protein [Saprospiraceae bacterium]
MLAKFNPEFIVLGYDHKFGLNRRGDISMLKIMKRKETLKLLRSTPKKLKI